MKTETKTKTKTKLIVALGFLFSVGTAAAAPAAPAAPAAAPAAPAAAAAPATMPTAKIDWDKMSKADRKKYMKTTVLPEMKKVFAEADAKKYKGMTCATCHGSKAAEVKFKMPNPQLPKLPAPTDRAGFMAVQQKKPDAVKFMGTRVKPTMAALIGEAEWTPANPKGFGCYGCHTQEAAPAAGGAAAPAPAAPAAPAPAPAAPKKP